LLLKATYLAIINPMAQSSNQNKYDSLLNQFLNNDNTAEEQEE